MNCTRRQALEVLAIGVTAAALPPIAHAAPSFPQGAVIRTVLKDYDPRELESGATLFHEHVSIAPSFPPEIHQAIDALAAANRVPSDPPLPAQNPSLALNNFLNDLPAVVEEMKAAKKAGVACVVDAGHPDMGRDVGFLRQVSTKSGMPIVVSGGFLTEPYYPKAFNTMSEDEILGLLMKQVEADNIGAFGEIGSFDYISKVERKVFRAVGRAHLATNIPIFTHTGRPGKSALEQLDIFEDAGVDAKRVVIGHLGNLIDSRAEVHRAVCRRGAFVGFDRVGKGAEDDAVVPVVMALIEAGYVDNILFSSDFSTPPAKPKDPATGYAKTLTVFVPKMRQAGASEAILKQIMNDNPRRFLAFVPKIKRKA
jgi:phosphotriesterase-related protein